MAFEANVLQFGVEQLRDAPSREVATLMRWYFWSYDTGLNFDVHVFFHSSCLLSQCQHCQSSLAGL